MLKRCITGAVMIAVVVGFFFLREVDTRLFGILIALLAVVGTGEVARAFRSRAYKAEISAEGRFSPTAGDTAVIAAAMIVSAAIVPAYVFSGALLCAVILATGVAVVAVVKAFSHRSFRAEAPYALLLPLYPSLFLLAMLYVNSLAENGLFALVTIFVVGPLADTFAYLVGSLIGGKKLCPAVSPHKTVSGAIGGLVGGAVGGLVLYFIFKPRVAFSVPWLVFLFIGLIGAFFTEAGDLFESFLKRRCGVKDMGRILPGHGGVMDRIDGMLFISAFIAPVFALI